MDNKKLITEEALLAAEIIKNGGVILYPTDTIWGIGCDATNPDAVEKIFQIKKRDSNKSLIVLMQDINQIKKYVKSLPLKASDLINSAENPLTIIYPNAINLAFNVLATDSSIGIRIPKDEFCLELIKACGIPIVSTSANFSGEPSAANFNNISEELKNQVDYIVNFAQDLVKDAKPSRIIKLMEDGEVVVIRE